MGRILIQSKSSEGYRIFIAAPNGLNLLDSSAITEAINAQVLSEVKRNCLDFYKREGYMPSVISVDSSVETAIRNILDELELEERAKIGELKPNPDPKKYGRIVFVRIECKQDSSLVKVSSDCSVGTDYNVKITYCDED